MSKAYAGSSRADAGVSGRIDDGAGAPTRWGFSGSAGEPRLTPRTFAGAATPPQPGDHPIDGDGDFPELTQAMREANGQPLPGALPTMRFWMVILAGMAMVALAAAMML